MMRPPIMKELRIDCEEVEKGGAAECFPSSQIAWSVAQDTSLCSSL